MQSMYDKKNAEGYSDPTAYQAIKNMVKPGEVWTFQKKDNTEAEVLIIAFNDNIATILYLMDEFKEGCIEIVNPNDLHDVRYVNPRMLNWTWGGFLGKRVTTLTDPEFNQVLTEIEDVLSVRIVKETDSVENHGIDQAVFRETVEMKDELDALRRDYKELYSKLEKYQVLYERASGEAERLKVQLDTIKEMYSDLMEKFLQRA